MIVADPKLTHLKALSFDALFWLGLCDLEGLMLGSGGQHELTCASIVVSMCNLQCLNPRLLDKYACSTWSGICRGGHESQLFCKGFWRAEKLELHVCCVN